MIPYNMKVNKLDRATVFIIAVLTADGFIAENLHHTPMAWTSKADKEFFTKRTKEAGVIVMGLNTYKTIGRPLPDRLNIVYSIEELGEGIEVTQKDPQSLIDDLTKRGYREIAICGGSTIYTMFMESDVVDKLYLTIEPIIFGSGLCLFNKEISKNLRLVSLKKIGEQTVLLEYDMIKT